MPLLRGAEVDADELVAARTQRRLSHPLPTGPGVGPVQGQHEPVVGTEAFEKGVDDRGVGRRA